MSSLWSRICSQGVLRDVTERTHAEASLRKSEAQFHALFSKSRDTILLLVDGVYVDCNEACLEMLHATRDQVIGKSPSFFSPERQPDGQLSVEAVQEKIREVKETGFARFEWVHRRMDETDFWTEVVITYVKNDDWKGIFGVWRDITERKQVEDALREKEQFLADIFSSIQDGMSVLDSNLTIIRVNSKMEEWYSANLPLAGKKCYEAYRNRTEACDICPTLKTLKSGKTETEIVPGLPGSPVKWVELFSFPIKDRATGRVTGVVEFVRDITDRRQAEDERRKIEEKLRHTEKLDAIGHLAGGIAHDFNNQLTGIMGYADMLRISLAGDKELRDAAAMIVEAAKRAAHLTDQLLAFARKGKYQSVLVNLHDIITEVISLLKHSIDKRIETIENLKAKHPFTLGDDSQLQNALLNLAINARDAMPKGGKLTFATEEVHLDGDAERTLEAGASGFIQKPFQVAELSRKVAEALK